MSLHGKEKIYFFINRLIDEREVTEEGMPTSPNNQHLVSTL